MLASACTCCNRQLLSLLCLSSKRQPSPLLRTFGNTQPPPLDVMSITSVVSGVGAAPGYLMGMHLRCGMHGSVWLVSRCC